MSTRNTQPALLLLAILLLSACGSDSGFNEDTDFIVEDGFVQFVNMMPDSPEVIMLHGLDRTASEFPLVKPIERRAVDRYDWRIAYVDSNNNEITVAEGENQQVTADELSTFLWMGTLQQPNILIVDSPFTNTSERPAGSADVWFASNLTNHSMVDIYITDLDVELSESAPLATVTSGSFTSRFSVNAGDSRQLRITISGTTELLFDSGALEIPEQTEDLFALVDDFGPNGANHVDVIRSLAADGPTIRDESQPAAVRVGNYSNQATITATVDTTVFPDVTTQTRSGSQQTGNGIVDFSIVDAGDTVLEESPVPVARGIFQTIYTFDNNTTDATSVTRSLIIADSFRLVRDRALFKFINGSNQFVDLYLLRSGQDLDEVAPYLNNIGFAGTENNESVATTIEYVVRNADNTETLASTNETLQEGISYTLVFDTEGVLRLLTD